MSEGIQWEHIEYFDNMTICQLIGNIEYFDNMTICQLIGNISSTLII